MSKEEAIELADEILEDAIEEASEAAEGWFKRLIRRLFNKK